MMAVNATETCKKYLDKIYHEKCRGYTFKKVVLKSMQFRSFGTFVYEYNVFVLQRKTNKPSVSNRLYIRAQEISPIHLQEISYRLVFRQIIIRGNGS